MASLRRSNAKKPLALATRINPKVTAWGFVELRLTGDAETKEGGTIFYTIGITQEEWVSLVAKIQEGLSAVAESPDA